MSIDANFEDKVSKISGIRQRKETNQNLKCLLQLHSTEQYRSPECS